MSDAVLGAEDLGRLTDIVRVRAVQLHTPDALEVVEDEHVLRTLVALHEPA